jgi:hypothetical protein
MRAMVRGLVLSGLVAITASCAPFGEGVLGGGASSESFSSVGAPVPVGLPDQQAQELLMMASSNAIVASFDSRTFADIDVDALTSMDPSVRIAGDVPARVGVVSINIAMDDGLVMSTKSSSGKTFCVSVTGASLASFSPPEGGTVDAHGASSPGDCTGRDWVSNP